MRARWTPLTSRRFCDFCEIEQKQHDLLPRALVVIAFLIGAAGLTAYLTSDGESTRRPSSSTARIRNFKNESETKARSGPSGNVQAAPSNSAPASLANAPADVSPPNSKQREIPDNSSTEPVYYCGALTRKGTPCTRRVKAKGRCWQHIGQSALPQSRD